MFLGAWILAREVDRVLLFLQNNGGFLGHDILQVPFDRWVLLSDLCSDVSLNRGFELAMAADVFFGVESNLCLSSGSPIWKYAVSFKWYLLLKHFESDKDYDSTLFCKGLKSMIGCFGDKSSAWEQSKYRLNQGFDAIKSSLFNEATKLYFLTSILTCNSVDGSSRIKNRRSRQKGWKGIGAIHQCWITCCFHIQTSIRIMYKSLLNAKLEFT